MDLWIVATLAAAFFQTLRFMLQKQLNMQSLSAAGATFARFAYAAPFLLLGSAAYLAWTGQGLPRLSPGFWGYAVLGGLTQILATVCVVLLFQSRNFAVGVTFKKTEVLMTVGVSLLVLGEGVSWIGLFAMILGLVGVFMLSAAPDRVGGWRARFDRRSVGLGLSSGLLFAFSGVSYRGASLQLDYEAPLARAAITLTVVVLLQTLAMTAWLARREPGQIGRVLAARRMAVWIGITSLLGSLGWFTAFTLQNAAYVNALGQVELVFSLAASALFFRERISMRELTGILVLAASLVILILSL